MAIPLPVRPNRSILSRFSSSPFSNPPVRRVDTCYVKTDNRISWWCGVVRTRRTLVSANSRADDSAPFEMSLENALKLLGVSEGASFDDILRAKNSILAGCKDDQETIARVEAAYDMLLMQSLTQRRAGKVVSSNIRFADVKPIKPPGMGSMPQWLQGSVKNSPVSIESPSTGELGIQAGVYGALMVLTYVNGAATPSVGSYTGADVPGLLLATSFGASLYFMTKKNIKLGQWIQNDGLICVSSLANITLNFSFDYGICIKDQYPGWREAFTWKATLITVGGLVAGAAVGSAVENWLQVDIVPFLGIHSPAAVVSEFILFSQLLVSLYLR